VDGVAKDHGASKACDTVRGQVGSGSAAAAKQPLFSANWCIAGPCRLVLPRVVRIAGGWQATRSPGQVRVRYAFAT
jgi:hypothetical protein